MEKKSSLIVIMAMLLAILGIGFASRACEATQSAKEAQRQADIAAAIDRAEVAEAAADASQKEADALRLELEARSVKLAAKRQKITEHRKTPIDYKNVDIRELVHSFALLGYGLPR